MCIYRGHFFLILRQAPMVDQMNVLVLFHYLQSETKVARAGSDIWLSDI